MSKQSASPRHQNGTEMANDLNDIERRIRRSRLEFATLRSESAAIVGLTLAGSALAFVLGTAGLVPNGTWIGVLLFGLLAEVAIVASSLSDQSSGTPHVVVSLADHFRVHDLRDAALREHLRRAFECRIRLHDVLNTRAWSGGDALGQTVASVDGWLAGICRLASRLDRLREEASFQSESKQELLERVADLKARAAGATNAGVRQQLAETLDGRLHQVRVIEELENTMERGELQLEQAVGALGTIHTQVIMFAAKGMDAGDAARMTGEINNERAHIDAVLRAMDRIHEPTS